MRLVCSLLGIVLERCRMVLLRNNTRSLCNTLRKVSEMREMQTNHDTDFVIMSVEC